MNRTKTAAGLALGATLMTGGLTLVAGSASAATLGTITFAPSTGNESSLISFVTATKCTDANAQATNLSVSMVGGDPAVSGSVIPSPVNVVGNSTAANYDAGNGMSIPISDILKSTFQANNVSTPSGVYTFDVKCRTAASSTSLGDFTGQLKFTPTGANAGTYVTVVAPQATTTTVTASAASINFGDSETLTAAVAPAAATGSVQFQDGGSSLGSPVPLSGGSASTTTTALPAGSRSITAVYTPDAAATAAGYQASTSPATTVTVNKGVIAPTLTVSPAGSAAQYSNVTLTAALPAGAAGSVDFLDNATKIGSGTVSGGSATYSTSALAVGSHSLTATFTSTDPNMAGGTSSAVTYAVTAFAGVTATENITTTVAPGALTIAVADPNVTLPNPTLTPAGDLFHTDGKLKPVVVTDTRAGNPGWNASGQCADFAGSGSHAIGSANLGWTPNVVGTSGAAQVVSAGSPVEAAHGVAPGSTGGLSTSRTLATAAAGQGNGTATLDADLALNVPTTTAADTYTALLTLTAI